MDPSPRQSALIEELHAERARLANPIDRVVFDNARHQELPGLPVGLWLLAFPASEVVGDLGVTPVTSPEPADPAAGTKAADRRDMTKVLIHAMNPARRSAFDLMRRQSLRARAPMRCYFLNEVMGTSLAGALEDLGWLTILPGRKGRPSQIHLTDVGLWILGGAS